MFVVPLMHERDQQYGVKYIEQREIVQGIIYRVFPLFLLWRNISPQEAQMKSANGRRVGSV